MVDAIEGGTQAAAASYSAPQSAPKAKAEPEAKSAPAEDAPESSRGKVVSTSA